MANPMPPLPSEAQNFMPIHNAKGPALNAKDQVGPLAYLHNIVAKTASYTAKVSESGTLFTTLGASGAVVITLPAVADAAGCVFGFFNAVDQSCGVAVAADTMVYDGDAAITSLTWQTSSHKIGGAAMFFCDGSKWYALVAVNGAAAPTAA